MSGIVNFLSGVSAEDAVAADYERRGMPVVAKRWRGSRGEIDLVARDGDGFVFVEVKKSKTIARAAQRLSMAQLGRICNTALEFVAGQPMGQLTEMRFDFARVDGQGRFDILENATQLT
ncbi:MAG: YraN family protein [Maritimibacter sp.]